MRPCAWSRSGHQAPQRPSRRLPVPLQAPGRAERLTCFEGMHASWLHSQRRVAACTRSACLRVSGCRVAGRRRAAGDPTSCCSEALMLAWTGGSRKRLRAKLARPTVLAQPAAEPDGQTEAAARAPHGWQDAPPASSAPAPGPRCVFSRRVYTAPQPSPAHTCRSHAAAEPPPRGPAASGVSERPPPRHPLPFLLDPGQSLDLMAMSASATSPPKQPPLDSSHERAGSCSHASGSLRTPRPEANVAHPLPFAQSAHRAVRTDGHHDAAVPGHAARGLITPPGGAAACSEPRAWRVTMLAAPSSESSGTPRSDCAVRGSSCSLSGLE